eukprot:CAMPEP_0170763012 /NCGR_PEP_ID=MMETSP0733-20121128/3120_1 /TAXON_ID=186038 /ORGANISM="Fragilariopsis kerguelensis, Strain L26-C5" /LENGTH=550 /DNA_ID=CAMNT_0011103319 /DNA_START=109 /DNA_END=1761 /DNA_ORIENTATION=-
MTIVMVMVMVTTIHKACSSFVLPSISHSSIKKFDVATKGILIHHRSRSFLSNLTSIKLFSSANLSQSASSDNSSKERKYQELMGASLLQLAPMMEYTDRHFRHVIRLISGKTLLYTEMIAANALARERSVSMDEYSSSSFPPPSDREIRTNYADQYIRRYLGQGLVAPEGPSVLQLGGSDPNQLSEAAQTVMDMTERGWCDYTAINLNCGCPSPKVAGKGSFGAALMDSPKLVSELTNALHDGCDGKIPVTVKCRIGTDTHHPEPFTRNGYSEIDSQVEYSRLCSFIEQVASNSPVTDFSVHARIAVLRKSFSPSDNRKIPPLKYEFVHRLVQDYPELTFTLNGGIDTLSQVQEELEICPDLNGVMVGRGFAADPWGFSMADKLLYKTSVIDDGTRKTPMNRLELLTEYGKHADAEEESGDPVKIRRFITKAVSTLFTAEPNAKRYRIALNEVAGLPKRLKIEGKGLEGQPPLSELILNAAHSHLSEEVLLRTPEESYERNLYDERKLAQKTDRSIAVADWQSDRLKQQKENGLGVYESALAYDDTSVSR